jgi:hypothetical protein
VPAAPAPAVTAPPANLASPANVKCPKARTAGFTEPRQLQN